MDDAWSLTPEERELRKKQQEARLLEGELSQRRRRLESLRDSLATFEATYLHILGSRFTRLHQLEVRLAEQSHPPVTRSRRGHAEGSRPPGLSEQRWTPAGRTAPKEAPAPSETAKRLHRRIAAAIHPDRAADPAERAWRTRLMAEANRVYGEGDTAALHRILRLCTHGPESVAGDGVAADLVRAIRRIAALEEDLALVEEQAAALERSHLWKVKQRFDEAHREGWDLLVELTLLLDSEITTAARQLAEAERRARGERTGHR